MAARNPSTHTLDAATGNAYAEDSGTSIAGTAGAFCHFFWFYPTNTTGTQGVFGNYTANDTNVILCRMPSTNLEYFYRGSSGSLGSAVEVSGVFTVNTWHGVAVVNDETNQYAYVGQNKSGVHSKAGWGGNTGKKIALGYRSSSQAAPEAHYGSYAAWVGGGIPTEDQIKLLTAGDIHPLALRPDHWYPMDHTSGSPIDMVGGVNLDLSAASFTSDVTPRRYTPLPIGPTSVTRDTGAAPAGDVRPRFYHHRHHNLAA